MVIIVTKENHISQVKNMTTLNEFVKRNLHCSYDEAAEFISKLRHYDAVEYGRNIIKIVKER